MEPRMARGIIFILFLAFALSGCTLVVQKRHASDVEKIGELSARLQKLKELKDEEIEKLNRTKKLLESRLKKEIEDKQIRLKMAQKGLVITFVDEVLFDSGKADIRKEAYPALDKIARVLIENVPDREIGIEGHTDNEPIKYSGWKSNWELSTARATSVLHYLVDEKGIAPERVTAIGYGEYRPVATNATAQGRQLNRRVEIVILPKIAKIRPQEEALVPEEELQPVLVEEEIK
jgi:chemotaxis protein MotB